MRWRNKATLLTWFQFHKVRLKEELFIYRIAEKIMFQFHKVRLKARRARKRAQRGFVSIPQGTIKR